MATLGKAQSMTKSLECGKVGILAKSAGLGGCRIGDFQNTGVGGCQMVDFQNTVLIIQGWMSKSRIFGNASTLP